MVATLLLLLMNSRYILAVETVFLRKNNLTPRSKPNNLLKTLRLLNLLTLFWSSKSVNHQISYHLKEVPGIICTEVKI